MTAALIALVLMVVVLGAGGFALHILWYVLAAALLLWLIGFFLRAAGEGGRWYFW